MTTDIEPESPWQIRTLQRPYLQWVHKSAEGWFRHIKWILDNLPGSFESIPLERRRDEMLDLVGAIASFYKAVDLPPTADPFFRSLVELPRTDWTRNLRAVENYKWLTGLAKEREAEAFVGMPSFCEAAGISFQHRLMITAGAGLDVTYLDNGGPELLASVTRPYTERDECVFVAAQHRVGATYFLSWQQEWSSWRRLAAEIVRRGIDGTLMDSRTFVFLKNVQQAGEFGVEEAAELANLAQEQFAAVNDPTVAETTVYSVVSTVATAIMAIVPVGTVIGGLIDVVAAALMFFRAVGYIHDDFGRVIPFYEPAWLTGWVGPDREPTQDPGDPGQRGLKPATAILTQAPNVGVGAYHFPADSALGRAVTDLLRRQTACQSKCARKRKRFRAKCLRKCPTH